MGAKKRSLGGIALSYCWWRVFVKAVGKFRECNQSTLGWFWPLENPHRPDDAEMFRNVGSKYFRKLTGDAGAHQQCKPSLHYPQFLSALKRCINKGEEQTCAAIVIVKRDHIINWRLLLFMCNPSLWGITGGAERVRVEEQDSMRGGSGCWCTCYDGRGTNYCAIQPDDDRFRTRMCRVRCTVVCADEFLIPWQNNLAKALLAQDNVRQVSLAFFG